MSSRPPIAEQVENGTPVSVEAKRPRRRMKVILTLALSGMLGGFLVSFLFRTIYTSQSTVVMEDQKVPETYVPPLITSDFSQRMQTLSQETMSEARLRPVIESLNLVKAEDENKIIDDIRNHTQFQPLITSMSAAAVSGGYKKTPAASALSGVNIVYTDSSPERAQKMCSALTELMLTENLRERAEVLHNVTEFLNRQLQEAKRTLDEQDAKIAAFEKQYVGKLPTDSRRAMSPSVEEQYKLLTRDNDTNEAFYKELLVKKRSAELSANMEIQQLGEQMKILVGADLPDAPDFPNRPLLALGGLGAGLLLGLGRALWPIREAKTVPQVTIPSSDLAGTPEKISEQS